MECKSLLNRSGALYGTSELYTYTCVQNSGDYSPLCKYSGFGVYSINKTGKAQIVCNHSVIAVSWILAAAQHLFNTL
jgi:hypothetical protein